MDCSKPIYCCHLWDDFMKSIWSPVLPSQNVCCHWKMTFSNFPVLQNLVGNKVPTKLRVSPSNWHGHSLPPTDISSSNLSSTPTVHKIYKHRNNKNWLLTSSIIKVFVEGDTTVIVFPLKLRIVHLVLLRMSTLWSVCPLKQSYM